MYMQTSRNSRLFLVTLTLIFAWGCGGSFGQVTPGRSSRGDITRAELDQTSFLNAHNAIEALRPNWLWRRGSTTIMNPDPFPIVYVDGMRRGDLEELYSIAAEDVDTITLVSPADATTRWGTGHLGGAIHLRTRRGRGPDPSGPVNG